MSTGAGAVTERLSASQLTADGFYLDFQTVPVAERKAWLVKFVESMAAKNEVHWSLRLRNTGMPEHQVIAFILAIRLQQLGDESWQQWIPFFRRPLHLDSLGAIAKTIETKRIAADKDNTSCLMGLLTFEVEPADDVGNGIFAEPRFRTSGEKPGPAFNAMCDRALQEWRKGDASVLKRWSAVFNSIDCPVYHALGAYRQFREDYADTAVSWGLQHPGFFLILSKVSLHKDYPTLLERNLSATPDSSSDDEWKLFAAVFLYGITLPDDGFVARRSNLLGHDGPVPAMLEKPVLAQLMLSECEVSVGTMFAHLGLPKNDNAEGIKLLKMLLDKGALSEPDLRLQDEESLDGEESLEDEESLDDEGSLGSFLDGLPESDLSDLFDHSDALALIYAACDDAQKEQLKDYCNEVDNTGEFVAWLARSQAVPEHTGGGAGTGAGAGAGAGTGTGQTDASSLGKHSARSGLFNLTGGKRVRTKSPEASDSDNAAETREPKR